MSTIAEIQQAIQRLPQQDKRALSNWLSEATNPSLDERSLTAMAADPQIQLELRQIHREFATAEADGLGEG